MALIPCRCPVCNQDIAVADDREFTFCTNCGAKLLPPTAAVNAGSAFDTPSSPYPQQVQYPGQPAPAAYDGYAPGRTPVQPVATQATTPFLAQWKTGVGATIAGILVSAAVSGVSEVIVQTATTNADIKIYLWACFLVTLVWAILCFAVPPKRFKPDYRGSNGGVSFVNGLLGGIIFGCLWNSNLTNKNTKQCSHIVLGIIELLIALYLGYYAVMMTIYL